MAFSDEVLQQKLNSDIINLPGKKVLVMHYNDFHPVKLLDLKTVSSKVKKILIKMVNLSLLNHWQINQKLNGTRSKGYHGKI